MDNYKKLKHFKPTHIQGKSRIYFDKYENLNI